MKRTLDERTLPATDIIMGISEWGFHIENTVESFSHVKSLIDTHNSFLFDDRVGEDLKISCILSYHGELYVCASNDGGRDGTSEFICANYSQDVYYPFDKPSWWMKAPVVWRSSPNEKQPSFPLEIPDVPVVRRTEVKVMRSNSEKGEGGSHQR